MTPTWMGHEDGEDGEDGEDEQSVFSTGREISELKKPGH